MQARILFLKALPPGARWITVRPNGPGTDGHPVLIQPAATAATRRHRPCARGSHCAIGPPSPRSRGARSASCRSSPPANRRSPPLSRQQREGGAPWTAPYEPRLSGRWRRTGSRSTRAKGLVRAVHDDSTRQVRCSPWRCARRCSSAWRHRSALLGLALPGSWTGSLQARRSARPCCGCGCRRGSRWTPFRLWSRTMAATG